jgi:hypothetical protein
MPTPKQMEKLALQLDRLMEPPIPTPGPADALPDAYWDAVLRDPRASTIVPIQHRRLSEIPRHVLRVACRRCDRIVEIQRLDAVKLYGADATWKDVGVRLLDNGCQQRTGNRDDDGCWPDFDMSRTYVR